MHPLKRKTLRQIQAHLIKYPFALLATLTTQIFSFVFGVLFVLIIPILGFVFAGFWGILITIASWWIFWGLYSEDVPTPKEIVQDNLIEIEQTIVHYISTEGYNSDNAALFKWFRFINPEMHQYARLTNYLTSLSEKLEETYTSNPSDGIFTNLRHTVKPTKFTTLNKPDVIFWYYDVFSNSLNREPIIEIMRDIKILKSRVQSAEDRALKKKLRDLENKQEEKLIEEQKILRENAEIVAKLKNTPADKSWRTTLKNIEKSYKEKNNTEFPWVVAAINGEWVVRRNGQQIQLPTESHINNSENSSGENG